jgi:hypothetical protein
MVDVCHIYRLSHCVTWLDLRLSSCFFPFNNQMLYNVRHNQYGIQFKLKEDSTLYGCWNTTSILLKIFSPLVLCSTNFPLDWTLTSCSFFS